MGCSTGRQLSNTISSIFPETINGIKFIPIYTQREIYFKNHENFTLLQLNTSFSLFLNESKPEDELHLNTFIDLLFDKFYADFSNMKMTKEDVRDTVMEQILEQACVDELHYRTINFENVIGEIIENAEMGYLNAKKEEMMTSFFLTSRRYFAQLQKSISIKPIGHMKHIFNNLKFSKQFDIGLLKIEFSNKMFDDEFNIVNIAELISERETLTGITMKFSYDYTAENVKEKTMYITDSTRFIFDAIDLNFSVRWLVLAGNEYSREYRLPSLVYNSFLTTIRNDRLFALVVSKIYFDTLQIKELLNVLCGLENLKFVILDFETMTNEIIEEIVKGYILKNRKILFCGVAGGELNVNNEEMEIRIKKENYNFKYFIYSPHINLIN